MSTLINHATLVLCFVAGKSGGHLLPCITQAEKILKTDPTSQVHLFSSGSDLDNKIMEKHSTIQHFVPYIIDSIPYQKPWLFPYFIYSMGAYFINSIYELWSMKPEKVISFGGLNSIPVCLAGKLIGIPFDLYELNVEPGRAVTFLSYFTDQVYICFSQTANYLKSKKCELAPYPVRFTKKDLEYNRLELLQKFELHPDKSTILILGGSQGSIFVNQAIKNCLESNPELSNKVQVIHQIGMYDHDEYEKFYASHNIPAIVFAYNEQLQNFYNLADLIICRAGAGTLFEVEFFKKPCIIIPLQTDLNDHQLQNADAMEEMVPEQFSVLLQKNCEQKFLATIQSKLIN